MRFVLSRRSCHFGGAEERTKDLKSLKQREHIKQSLRLGESDQFSSVNSGAIDPAVLVAFDLWVRDNGGA